MTTFRKAMDVLLFEKWNTPMRVLGGHYEGLFTTSTAGRFVTASVTLPGQLNHDSLNTQKHILDGYVRDFVIRTNTNISLNNSEK